MLQKNLSIFSFSAVLAIMILGMPPTAAQLPTATVSGTVADSTGAIIP